MTNEIAASVIDDVVRGAVNPLNFDPESYKQLLAVLALIGESWPIERDASTYAMYLSHDCYDLAEILRHVADEATRIANR